MVAMTVAIAFNLVCVAAVGYTGIVKSSVARTRAKVVLSTPPPPQPIVEPVSYADAEKFGLALFAAGDYEGAIRRFEQAKKLPGDGYDVVRVSPGGGGDRPANPRGLVETRFASPAQIAIAEYNIACAKLKLGAREEALDRLRAFAASVENPARQFERMLSDPDLAELRADLKVMEEELKAKKRWDPFGGLKKLLDQPFVEWKK
jgi:tetratricopeptide (TPR) repeat protein